MIRKEMLYLGWRCSQASGAMAGWCSGETTRCRRTRSGKEDDRGRQGTPAWLRRALLCKKRTNGINWKTQMQAKHVPVNHTLQTKHWQHYIQIIISGFWAIPHGTIAFFVETKLMPSMLKKIQNSLFPLTAASILWCHILDFISIFSSYNHHMCDDLCIAVGRFCTTRNCFGQLYPVIPHHV
jgi:hypothetical protein